MANGHQIAMALRDAYWAMHRATDACLRPLGVTANQYVLLTLLAEEDAVSQRDLVERAASDPNTVRAMLLALEARGLLTRGRLPHDRRVRSVALTEEGHRACEAFRRASEATRLRLVEAVRADHADTLIETLERVCTAMNDDERRERRG